MRGNFVFAAMLGILSFSAFRWSYLRYSSVHARAILASWGLLSAVPAVLFASNYIFCIPYAKWFYEFHALPGAEITSGLMAGILGVMFASARLRPARLNTPILAVCTLMAVGLLAMPFIKQLLWSADYASLQDKWQDGVCLQTSSCTCVPACGATVAKMLGGNLTEAQLARDAGTTRTGTESWYLMRALRRRQFEPEFRRVRSIEDAPVRSIIGVKIGDIGHVVVLLDKDKRGLTIGEPLHGRKHYSWSVFRRSYRPDGSVITIKKLDRPSS